MWGETVSDFLGLVYLTFRNTALYSRAMTGNGRSYVALRLLPSCLSLFALVPVGRASRSGLHTPRKFIGNQNAMRAYTIG